MLKKDIASLNVLLAIWPISKFEKKAQECNQNLTQLVEMTFLQDVVRMRYIFLWLIL